MSERSEEMPSGVSEFKLSRQALESTLELYEENLCKLKNNDYEIPIYGRCPVCNEIRKAAKKGELMNTAKNTALFTATYAATRDGARRNAAVLQIKECGS